MTTINPVGPQTSSLPAEGLAGTTGTAETEAGQAYTPLWQINTSSTSSSLALLGIRMPSATGDLAVMLAQASLNLEQSIDESRKSSAIGRLAGLAAALYAYDLEALANTAERHAQAVATAEQNLTQVKGETEGLLAERNAKNSEIQAHKNQIEQIETILADNPDLPPAAKAFYADLLAQAEAGLASALTAREAIDVELANARIDSLDRQVAALEAQLAAVEPDTPEAEEIAAVLAEKRGQAEGARQQLDDFLDGPRTEAARNEFSESNAAALQAETQDLAARLEGYREAYGQAIVELESSTVLALAMIIRATAFFNTTHMVETNQNANRDKGIEREFEKIYENLQEAERAAMEKIEDASVRQSRATDEMRENRIRQAAFGLVTALSEIVSLIARIEPDALNSTSVLPTNGARVRVEV